MTNRFIQLLIVFGVGIAFGLLISSRVGISPGILTLQSKLEAAELALEESKDRILRATSVAVAKENEANSLFLQLEAAQSKPSPPIEYVTHDDMERERFATRTFSAWLQLQFGDDAFFLVPDPVSVTWYDESKAGSECVFLSGRKLKTPDRRECRSWSCELFRRSRTASWEVFRVFIDAELVYENFELRDPVTYAIATSGGWSTD